MMLRNGVAVTLFAIINTGLALTPGNAVQGQPYDIVAAFEEIPLHGSNSSSAADADSASSFFARQSTGRCFTSSGERFDCENPAIDSCCQGATKKGCCDGTKQLRCITPNSGEAFCCSTDSTPCGATCCAYGWSCCNAAGGTCCSNDYGQCCGGICCEKRRQCCGGTCCSLGFECSSGGSSCVRKTTPVMTVTETTVVSAQRTNKAMGKTVGIGSEYIGVAVAVAGLL